VIIRVIILISFMYVSYRAILAINDYHRESIVTETTSNRRDDRRSLSPGCLADLSKTWEGNFAEIYRERPKKIIVSRDTVFPLTDSRFK